MQYTKKQLAEILAKHQKWSNSQAGGEKANFANKDLSYGDLTYAKLKGANLNGANLEGAWGRGADFRNVDFSGAKMRLFDFCGANLQGANFTSADLTGADFTGATMVGANFDKATLDFSAWPLWSASHGADMDDAWALLLVDAILGAKMTGTRGKNLQTALNSWKTKEM